MTAAGATKGTLGKPFFASTSAALKICAAPMQTSPRIAMRLPSLFFVLCILLHSAAAPVLAHGTRGYALTAEATRWQWLELAIASAHAGNVRFAIEGDYRLISADGLPDHETGRFPSRSNPNRISAQHYELRVPARPQIAARITALRMQSFGFAINGVPIDPGAAEFWNNDRNWQYEAMSGALPLGLDQSNAHVQPSGAYHYHGLPTALLARFAGATTPVLVGWAASRTVSSTVSSNSALTIAAISLSGTDHVVCNLFLRSAGFSGNVFLSSSIHFVSGTTGTKSGSGKYR